MANNLRIDVSKLESFLRRSGSGMDDVARILATTIQAEIVTSFGSGPPGETYLRGHVRHVASSPGYPPNVDIGALTASIDTEKLGQASYAVKDGVEYGFYLEEGTDKVSPRPFMMPAFETIRDDFVDVVAKEIATWF